MELWINFCKMFTQSKRAVRAWIGKYQSTSADDTSLNINALPDLPVLLVFDLLPLNELLQSVGDVCSKWEFLQKKALLSRRTITLLIGPEAERALELILKSHFTVPHLPELLCDHKEALATSRLDIEQLDQAKVDWLLETFPNVRHLRISIADVSCAIIDPVICLLERLAPTLETLEIYSHFRYEHGKSTIRKELNVSEKQFELLDAINSRLPALKRLTLELGNTMISYDECSYRSARRIIDLPILERLHEFNFYTADQATFVDESFKKYATKNRNLHTIRLFDHLSRDRCWAGFLQLAQQNPALAKKFTQFRLLYCQITPEILTRFCDAYSSVTTLDMYIEKQISMAELTNALAKFKNLKTLNWCINGSSKLFEKPQKGAIAHPVESVRSLHLRFSSNEHGKKLKSLRIRQVFPGLEVISIAYEYFPEDVFYFNPHLRDPCMDEQYRGEFARRMLFRIQGILRTHPSAPRLILHADWSQVTEAAISHFDSKYPERNSDLFTIKSK